jgi:hypothetical protein
LTALEKRPRVLQIISGTAQAKAEVATAAMEDFSVMLPAGKTYRIDVEVEKTPTAVPSYAPARNLELRDSSGTVLASDASTSSPRIIGGGLTISEFHVYDVAARKKRFQVEGKSGGPG